MIYRSSRVFNVPLHPQNGDYYYKDDVVHDDQQRLYYFDNRWIPLATGAHARTLVQNLDQQNAPASYGAF